jgi:hypothetical protein
MASAKRRINSTNRKRVGQEAVDIRLLETPPGSPQRATATLKLEEFGFSPAAIVVIEAYRSSSLMRFECGTIGNLKVPPVMVLDEIDEGGNIQFRVKIVDNGGVVGRLLGSASRIRPLSNEDKNGRRSLLPIRWSRTLGQELWRVTVDDEEPPALVLNVLATGLDNRILADPMLRAAIMPAAFRLVLEKLIVLTPPEDDDDADWKNDWLKFCAEELGIDRTDIYEIGMDEKRKWVSQAVEEFSSRAGFVDQIRNKSPDGASS